MSSGMFWLRSRPLGALQRRLASLVVVIVLLDTAVGRHGRAALAQTQVTRHHLLDIIQRIERRRRHMQRAARQDVGARHIGGGTVGPIDGAGGRRAPLRLQIATHAAVRRQRLVGRRRV